MLPAHSLVPSRFYISWIVRKGSARGATYARGAHQCFGRATFSTSAAGESAQKLIVARAIRESDFISNRATPLNNCATSAFE